MVRQFWRAIAALTFLAANSSAQAVLLAPGSTEALPGTTSAAEPQLAGTIIEDETVSFTIGASIAGDVQLRVVRSTLDGSLDFYWRVFNANESGGSIGSFRIGEFFAPEYNANYRTDGLGDVAPTSATRFSGALDSYVNFNFRTPIGPGDSSPLFFLDTTATDYDRTAVYDVTNVGQTEISSTEFTFAPRRTVPEPGTAALLGIACALLAAATRKPARRRPS
jgi:hypothetical protein